MLTKLPFSFGLFAFHNWLGESQLGKLFNNAGIAKKRATIKSPDVYLLARQRIDQLLSYLKISTY